MRCIVLKRFGEPEQAFELREADTPKPSPMQVLIKVEAFGLNFADVLARKGLYPETPPRPCVLGYDVVGSIVESGRDVPAGYTGRRVVALTRFGGYAEYVSTDHRAVAFLDEDYPAEQALALGTQFTTAYICFYESMRLYPGSKVLVHAAAGGVGIALCQMALDAGCEVFATVGSDQKLDYVRRLGVQYPINYRKRDYAREVRSLLQGSRLDASFNSLAGSTIRTDLSLLGSGGKLVVYGAASRVGKRGGILSSAALLLSSGFVSPLSLIMRSKSIIGINILKLGDYKPELVAQAMQEVVKMATPGPGMPQCRIRPVVGGRYDIQELAEAHRKLEQRSTIGKLGVFW